MTNKKIIFLSITSLAVIILMGTTSSAYAIITPPTADAGGPYSGEVGVPVDFDGTGYEGDNPITEYLWDFGDGGSATVEDPSHTYLTSGTFEVCLLVTDSLGYIGGDCTFAVISDTIPNLSCGPGTIEIDNQCVPTYDQITCGFGTVLEGNECVQDPATTQQISDLQGDLAECNVSLGTCNDDLLMCQGDLSDANDLITQLQSQSTITEGCEKGYWKNSKYFDQWSEAGIDPNSEFFAPFPPFVFSQGFPGPTFIEVLNIKNSTPTEKFAKEFITSALNLLHPDIDYPLTQEDISEITGQAFQNNDPDEILAGAAQLEYYNNMFCPLESSTIIPPQPEPMCGDGNLDEGEQCDDGNLVNGDGCSDSCEIEPPTYYGTWDFSPNLTTTCTGSPFFISDFEVEDNFMDDGLDRISIPLHPLGIEVVMDIPEFGQDTQYIASTDEFDLQWDLQFTDFDNAISHVEITNIEYEVLGLVISCNDVISDSPISKLS